MQKSCRLRQLHFSPGRSSVRIFLVMHQFDCHPEQSTDVIKEHKNIADTAAGLALLTFGLSLYFGQGSTDGTIWGPGGASKFTGVFIAICGCIAFCSYAKAKGRSGWLGLFLLPLNILGLIILLRLEDLSGRTPAAKCPQCTGINSAYKSECHYCESHLAGEG